MRWGGEGGGVIGTLQRLLGEGGGKNQVNFNVTQSKSSELPSKFKRRIRRIQTKR